MEADLHYTRPDYRPSGDDNVIGRGDWVKRLVRNEMNLIQTGSGDLTGHQDHRKVVEEATFEFLQKIKEEFVSCVDLFNSYRGGAQLPNSVKVFNVSNTAADFIIFRNNLKLVVSNPALGVVNLSFIQRNASFAQPQAIKTKREGYDLIAQMFPFNELAWTFHGEKVNVDAMVRFLFTDFVKSSALY
jgi:hypothetical protein